MPRQVLEFRGINRKHLGMYFEELGGKQISNEFPYVYSTDHWCGKIISEEELAITSTFKVNSVQIQFQSVNEETLKELIKQYRVKTRRIGG
ncbi:hypothetical protein [Bacillus sp. OK048]|uniref:hypothetical protein n=1 Tax=Bacillus sp. OK048 TaxID=1882761 RepID=UPI00088B98BC|nr:hypothetical protein [Bacillus sp. OK048]SDN13858.1 hypothetical protein SAMN05443253_108172 [Bacillus sp. OK048]